MTIHAEFAPNNYLDVTISPNPAREKIRIEFMQNIEYVAVISLIDMKGITLMERTLSPGDNTSGTLSIEGTEPGIYIISISYGQYRINKMVVII